MATVSSYESMTQPGRHELKQFAELFEPVFKASSPEARRTSVAALSRCATLPQAVAWFLGNQPIDLAALFLTRSPAVDDETLIAIARSQGPAHARAIAARENLSVKVVDALVSLHQGHERSRLHKAEPMSHHFEQSRAGREEELRQQLKALVHRDTLARAGLAEENDEEIEGALLVRFALLRQVRDFSRLLATMLDASQWLTNRVILDVSGLQLAAVLTTIGLDDADGIFILRQFYPHLAADAGDGSRAQLLWTALDPEECAERVRAWIRADNYTQGKEPSEHPANANANDHTIATEPVRRHVFGYARGSNQR